MPIIQYKNLAKSAWYALWKIHESIDELLDLVELSKNDQQILDAINNPQKKLEWLSSRLTVRYLMEENGCNFVGISKDEFSKPYLPNYPYEISLTHSYPFAGAILNFDCPVGIDIEKPREKIFRIATRFLHPDEAKFADHDLDLLSILWSAKETLYKIYGKQKLIFRENLFIFPFDKNNSQSFQGEIRLNNGQVDRYTLAFESIENHFVVYNL